MNLIDIYNDMVRIGEEAKDRKLRPSEISKLLQNFVGSDDIKVKTSRDNNVDLNQVVIGGLYDPHEDEANSSSITLYVSFNPEQKEIYIRDIDWPQVCVDIIECSGHEIIHQEQYRARGYDIGPHIFVSGSDDEEQKIDQEYLGNPDEVDAYGYSIAVEIYLKEHPQKLKSKNVLSTVMYKTYKKAFGTLHPIVTQLLVNTIKYYTQLTNGEAHVKKSKRTVRR